MALPSSGTIAMNQISAELGGENNLGYYRGRQYYRGSTPVTISQNPSFSEFYGLQTLAPVPPLNREPIYAVDLGLAGNIQIAYRPRTGELWVWSNAGGNIKSWNPLTLVDPSRYQSLGINYSVQAGGGLTTFSVDQGLACTSPDDFCIIGYAGNTGGIIIYVDVTGNPK